MKDVVDRQKESVRYRQEWRLKSMLNSGQITEVTGYDISNTIAETGNRENTDIYGRLQSDQFRQNCSNDLRTHPTTFETEGGELTYSRGEHLTTGSGAEGLSVINFKMRYEQTQASNLTDITKMILGQPRGHFRYFETMNMESTSSAGRYGVIGGDQKVTVDRTAEPKLR